MTTKAPSGAFLLRLSNINARLFPTMTTETARFISDLTTTRVTHYIYGEPLYLR